MNANYDVVVIGGGPAGAVAATFLQREGHKCLVLERSTFPRYHIGESLIPHTYGTLDRLGLLPKLKASHFPEKHSVRFVSPAGDQSQPFYFSETIAGDGARTWQVERSEFDQMCLDHARAAGVEVRMEAGVNQVIFEDERAVGVKVTTGGGEPETIRAQVVLDASGRATIIGSQLGLKDAVPGLDKSSLWAYYKAGRRETGIDAGETTILMLPDGGWFWYIPLPDDVVSVGIVDAPQRLFADSNDNEQVFLEQVERCAGVRGRLDKAERIGKIYGIRRLAYRNRQIAGDGWVMVGDAAAFLDPIYSSGLFLALASAELAAGCIHEALRAGDTSAARLGAFAQPLIRGVEVIRRLIYAFYEPNFSFGEFVKRFPDQRSALIDCLVGDVVEKDMSGFLEALAEMVAPPDPLWA